MQNTDSCQFCNEENKTRVIDVLGHPVRVKNYICSPDGVHYKKKPEQIRLQLSVCPTSFCPANCPFCIAQDTKTATRMDTERFASVMRRLKEQELVRGVKITGGEPFFDICLLNETVSILYEIFGHGLELSISTNGMRLDRLHEIKDLSYIETIHLSRHHYDDGINRSLFGGAAVPTGEEIRQIVSTVSYKDLFVINCMLLKDYIGTPAEAHRFLDFAIYTGVPKVGFMMCAPVNAYAAAQTIPYEEVIRDDDRSLLFTRGFYDYGICRCRDGVYVSNDGSIIEFYGRNTASGDCGYSRGLVYGADGHLRDGYVGAVIV